MPVELDKFELPKNIQHNINISLYCFYDGQIILKLEKEMNEYYIK